MLWRHPGASYLTLVAEYRLQRLSPGSIAGPAWVLATFMAWGLAFGSAYDRSRAAGFLNTRRVLLVTAISTILGVLPANLDDNGSPDVWMPTRFDWAELPTGNFGWNVTARLKPGITPQTAEAEFIPLVDIDPRRIEAPDYRAFLTNGRYA